MENAAIVTPEALVLKPDGQASLAELLLDSGVDLDMPCAGNHTCGKCRVKASGGLLPMSAAEARFLSREEVEAGIRLACFARTSGGEVTIEPAENERACIVGDGGETLSCGFLPLMAEDKYGLAVDIGTTTVVCSIYSGKEPKPLASAGELNRQRRFGADVISRICYGIEHGAAAARDAIRGQLGSMLSGLCARLDISPDDVTHAVVTGNTTMLHFFAGLDPEGIGFFPFTPASLFGADDSTALPGIVSYIPPCVGGYIGADLMCGILASKMTETDRVSCMVDIGTNGEMALFRDNILYCCSTAAGPAFEGGEISCGVPAYAGAICGVSFDERQGRVSFETVGSLPARGICGSGLIDAAAVMLSCGAIDGTGLLTDAGHPLAGYMREHEDGLRFVFPEGGVYISQADIRRLQLAKAAIRAGIEMLFSRAGLSPAGPDVFYICGGFGKFLNLRSAELIGLIPEGVRSKSVILGNGALRGAAMLLSDRSKKVDIERLAQMTRVIELSADSEFMDKYVESMGFSSAIAP